MTTLQHRRGNKRCPGLGSAVGGRREELWDQGPPGSEPDDVTISDKGPDNLMLSQANGRGTCGRVCIRSPCQAHLLPVNVRIWQELNST